MKLKTGPLLVIGLLVLLVGLSVTLTPAPPPSQGAHDHDHEAEEAEHAEETKSKEPPKPKLEDLKKAIASNNAMAQGEALKTLTEVAATTRSEQELKPIREYLLTLLVHDSEQVRQAAVGMLSTMQQRPDQELMRRLAQRDPSPGVRHAAILALARYPAGGPAEQTLRQLSRDPDAGIRSVAIVSLTQMLSSAGKAGNEELVKLLGQPDNDASAQAALKFHHQGATALPVLIKALQTSPDGRARHAAAMCIGLICAGYNPSIEKFARQAQVTHRQDFGHTKSNPAGVAPLIAALQKDPDPMVREVSAQGLGYLGDEKAAAPLAVALRDPDAYVRRRAAAALITVPAGSVVAELSTVATGDKVAEVRQFAVEALGWVGTSNVLPALHRSTQDKDAAVRRRAAIELGRLADPSSLEVLSAMLGDSADPDPDVRWAAVTAIGKLHDRRAQHILVRALSDTSPQVSNSAERALQRLGVARQESEGYEG